MLNKKNIQNEGKTPEALHQEKMRAKLIQQLDHTFDSLEKGAQDPAKLKFSFDHFLNAPELEEFFTVEVKKDMLAGIDRAVRNTEKDKFIAEMEEVLQPLIQARNSHPEQFEEVQVRIFNAHEGFMPLNKRISYGLDNDIAHIHLAPSFAVKEELPALFLDAMQKLAEIIKKNKEIKEVAATSWLLATKTYGDPFTQLGFEISDVSEEFKNKHFPGEFRPIKRAVMDREKFIKTFAKNKK